MAGAKFQYDESGSMISYFLLSFFALILIPSTYYCFIKKKTKHESERLCFCAECQVKHARLDKKNPKVDVKKILTKLLVVTGWALFVYIVYKTTQYEYKNADFDPYKILQIEEGASQAVIKSAYRQLSLIHHPDKPTGDQNLFMNITKAYEVLTDETARLNWEMYGNPDGPGAVSFGIALPSWIVDSKNSIWVLGLYILILMVALPVTVGTWWYRSSRYSGDQIHPETMRLYRFFVNKTPEMVIKRVLMILGASVEFHRYYNREIEERPSDNVEVSQLIKELPQLHEKNKEKPLCYTYSIKARSLLHAHLTRLKLPPATLDLDRQKVIQKCPYLIQEMVVCVFQLIVFAQQSEKPTRMPSLSTLEGCMKLSAMIVQALWEYKSPLMQLPHITDDNLKYFSSKRHQVRTLEQLARLKEEDRRAVLHHLDDDQYRNLVRVLGAMPYVKMAIKYEVIDDEAPTYFTAGAIVTVTVTLTRKNMSVLFEDEHSPTSNARENGNDVSSSDEEEKEDAKKKVMSWHKNAKKRKKANTKKKSTIAKKSAAKNDAKSEETEKSLVIIRNEPKQKEEEPESGSDESEVEAREIDEQKADENSDSAEFDKNDEKLVEFQKEMSARRQQLFQGKSQISHTVHCPYFPIDKQEYWWVYITSKLKKNLKKERLLTLPLNITDLVESKEIQLNFTTPEKPGMYTFAIRLRSDSYLGLDQTELIKMDVEKASEITTGHPQWEDMVDVKQQVPEIPTEHQQGKYVDEKDGGNTSSVVSDSDDDHEDEKRSLERTRRKIGKARRKY